MIKVNSVILLATLVVATGTGTTMAATSELAGRGLAVAEEADRRYGGFVDCEEIFTMILKDGRGVERTRAMRMKTLERTDDGDWTLTIFDKPADVKGTAMLTYSHGLSPDDQWLYLPALKRVKRISAKKKSGPFMGSEFAFEDLSSFEVEKYTYTFLREAPCGKSSCFVSEWVPAYEHSGYSRMEMWHDTDEYRVRKTVYFDRKNQVLKTMTLSDYRLFDEKHWRAMRYEMVNHQTGKSTLLIYSQYDFGLGFTERDFDQKSLKHTK